MSARYCMQSSKPKDTTLNGKGIMFQALGSNSFPPTKDFKSLPSHPSNSLYRKSIHIYILASILIITKPQLRNMYVDLLESSDVSLIRIHSDFLDKSNSYDLE